MSKPGSARYFSSSSTVRTLETSGTHARGKLGTGAVSKSKQWNAHRMNYIELLNDYSRKMSKRLRDHISSQTEKDKRKSSLVLHGGKGKRG